MQFSPPEILCPSPPSCWVCLLWHAATQVFPILCSAKGVLSTWELFTLNALLVYSGSSRNPTIFLGLWLGSSLIRNNYKKAEIIYLLTVNHLSSIAAREWRVLREKSKNVICSSGSCKRVQHYCREKISDLTLISESSQPMFPVNTSTPCAGKKMGISDTQRYQTKSALISSQEKNNNTLGAGDGFIIKSWGSGQMESVWLTCQFPWSI